VDSSPPPPRTKLRPWYFVVAMILTWFVGIRGMDFGLSTAVRLRSDTTPDLVEIARKVSSIREAEGYALVCAVQSMIDHPRVTFPLAIAHLLLSGLLVVASFLALGGRRGARSLALQAIVANAVLAGIAFSVTPFIRSAMVDGVTQAVGTLTVPANEAADAVRVVRWIMQTALITYLGSLAVGALALTRPRTKLFFDAMARVTEGPDGGT
jgi:hypothetical protein